MRRWIIALLAFGAAGLAVGRADSIWDRRDPRYAYLFQDNRARRIGDVLTVTVGETTVDSEQDARTMSRTTSGSGSLTLTNRLRVPASAGTGAATAGTPAQTVYTLPSQNTASSFAGSTQVTANRVFTDLMAVTVVDIMPNGNLVVEGYRSRVVQGEERVLRITGVVRPADIGVGNVVSSGSVANFRITYLGRGMTTRNNRPGFVTRVYNVFRPF
jgi:flagellar L-ring protein precursor FlgH